MAGWTAKRCEHFKLSGLRLWRELGFYINGARQKKESEAAGIDILLLAGVFLQRQSDEVRQRDLHGRPELLPRLQQRRAVRLLLG